MIEIHLRIDGNRAQPGAGVWLLTPGRMWRVWVCGSSIGTRQGFYRTRLPGDGLTGINWRRGQWAALAHTARRPRFGP